MKTENQVCNFQQAKKLSSFGLRQCNAFWVWDEIPFDSGNAVLRNRITATHDYSGKLAAYSVAELGAMLPDLIETTLQYELVCVKEDDGWLIMYIRNNNLLDHLPEIKLCAADTEAEARADMLIKLLEYKFIRPDDCNLRLKD